MNFRKQLCTARKARGLSQEELAVRLNVSRQTIYKWEAGITSPDIDMLCEIARLLGVSTAYLLGEEEICNSDTLAEEVATDAPPAICTDEEKGAAVHHYKRFARAIGACTMLILVSVAVLVLLNGLHSSPVIEAVSVVQLLCCIALAVVGYVVAGLRHEPFEKPGSPLLLFGESEIKTEQRGFVLRITAGLSLIFAGLIFVVIAGFSDASILPPIAVATFLALIGAAVYLFITAGILHDLYTGEGKNRKKSKSSEPAEAICGIIMLLATALFLVLGFVWGLWHPAWVAFPIGGILCGCVSIVCEAIAKRK